MKRKLTNRKSNHMPLAIAWGGYRLMLTLLAWMIVLNLSIASDPAYTMPFPVTAPSNDNLCNAIPLTLGASCAGYAYTTVDATIETNEPNPTFCQNVLKTVWFSFVAPPSGYVEINTPSSNNGLWMQRAVYSLTGGAPNCNNLSNLIWLGCSSDQYLPDNILTLCGLASGQTYYIQIATVTSPYEDDFCIEVRGEVLADAGPNQVLCNVTSTTLAANAPLFSEGLWTVISGTATITNPTSPTSGVTGLVPGTTATLEWNVGYCPLETFKGGPLGLLDYTSSDQMTITVDALPTTANAGFDRLTCDTFTNAIANTPIIGTGLWSVVSGTATLATPTLPTTIVTGLVHGTVTTLQWTITNGTCPPSTDQMTISTLTDPDSGPDQQLCTNVNSTTLAANPVTVGVGFWSVISGMATFADYSSPTTSVTLTPGVPTALEWFVFFPPEGCDRRDTMMITWANAPDVADAGPDQVICNQTTATLAANTPMVGTGLWTVVSGTATITNPSSPTSGVTGLVTGASAVLQWTITNGPCSSSSDQMTITTGEVTIADAGPDQDLCNGFDNTTNLEGNTPIIGTGLWTLILGSASISNPMSPTTSITVTPGYIALLHWTITNGACSSYDSVIIWSNDVIANAGPDQVLCNVTSTQLAGNMPPHVWDEGTWTVLSGSATITDPTLYNTTVTNLIPGTSVTLQWEIFSNASECYHQDEMTITIDALPTPADAGMNQSLCNQTTTTLAANTPVDGVGMWSLYSGTATITDPSSPTSGVTGLVIGTSAVLQWNISNGSCPPSTDQVTITVNASVTPANAGPDQILCDMSTTTLAANAPMFGTGSWTVVSGTASITDPSSPTSEITGLIPETSAVLEWTISSGSCTSSTDEVMITVDALPTYADAGPTQQLCDQFSTTLAGNTPVVGTGLWTFNAGTATIADPTSPTSGLTDLVPGTYVELHWTISNGSCPSSTDFVYIFDNTPTFTNAGMDQQLCNATTTELSADSLYCDDDWICETGFWTVINGTANITDPSSPFSEVTGLIPGTSVTLQWTLGVENDYFCAGTDQMTITVDALPTPADAGMNQSLCNQTTTTLAANTPVDGVGMWSLYSGTATITDPSSPTSGVTGLLPGTSAVLQWNITNGVCPPSADQVTITVYDLPTTSNAGPDQQFCNQTTTTLAANTPVVGSGQWSLISGTANITNPYSPTSGVTGLVPGTSAVLQWNITNGVCPASTDQVTITVYALPTTSNAGPDQQLCNQTTTTLAANIPVIGSGSWTLISGTATITTPGSPTSGVTGLVPGTSAVLQWSITNGTCPASTDQVTITVYDLPSTSNAGPDQQLCNQTTTTLAANIPAIGAGSWTLISGTATITTPGSPTSGVTGLVPGTSAVLQWNITNGVCPPSTDQMTITVYALPTTSNAGPDQQLCNQTTTTLAANIPVIGSGSWTLISGTATITTPGSPTSGVTGLVPGTSAVLQWSITNGTCPASTDQVTITVYDLPSTSNAGPDQQLCNQTTTTLAANTPVVGSGQWTVISGTATITAPASPTSGVTGLVAGTSAILQWNITNGTCPASTDQVIITVYALPTTSNAGPDQQLCNQPTTTLAANTPAVGSGLWTVISGSANITTPSSPTSGVTGLQPESTVVLQWTITNGTCPASSDQMTIHVFGLPTTSNAGADQQLCNQTTTSLFGNNPPIGSGLWSVVSGVANITNPASPASGVTGLVPGTSVTLQWSITNGVCPPSTDQMTITVYALPTTSNAGPDQQICNQTTTTLGGNTPVVGTGLWTVISGTATVTNPTSPTSGVTGLIPGTSATLQWKITNGTCPPSTDQMKIKVDALPSPADAGPDKFLCDETSTLLAAEVPLTGNGTWSVVNGTATVIPPHQPNALALNLVIGATATLQWAVTNGTCPASIDLINISVSEAPTESDAGPDQLICQSTSTNLQANTPDVGVGYWIILNGPGDIIDPESPTSLITGLVPGSPTTAQWTIWNGYCQPSSDEVTLEISGTYIPADAGPDQLVCGETSVSLSGNTPANGNGLWTLVQGSANIIDPNNPTTDVTGLIPGETVILNWTITNGDCPFSSDQMTIFVDNSSGFADAGPDQFVCDEATTMVQGNVPNSGSGMWTVISGNAIVTPADQPVAQVSNLVPGTSVVLQWTVSNGTCPSDSDQVVINVDNASTTAMAGIDQILCNEDIAQLSANTPVVGTGSWSVISGVATITDPASPTSMVTDLVAGSSTVLQWNITNGGCPPTTDQVTIQVDAPPTISDAGADQILCGMTNTILIANTPVIGDGMWTVVNGAAALSDPSSPVTAVTNLMPGNTVTVQWTISNGICMESSDQMMIQNDHQPTPANAGMDQVVCGEASTILEGNIPVYGEGVWTIVSGNATIADPASPVTALNDLQPGSTVTLHWTITNGTCPPSMDEVMIQANEAPTASDAGIDQEFCNETQTSLNANTPSQGTGQWEVISGPGMIADVTQPTSPVTGLVPGSPLVLQWVITYGECTSKDTMTISTNESPSQANAGEDQTICTTEAILSANTPMFGSGTWSVVSGTGTISDVSSPTSAVTGMIPGNPLVLQWKITNGACPESTDEVTLFVEPDMPLASAGDDQHLCGTSTTTMGAAPANIGSGTWTLVSGSATIEDPASPSTSVNGLLPGNSAILRWTVSGNACPPAFDDVVITIDDALIPASAGPDETICSADYMLSAENPLMGSGTWTIISGTGNIENPLDPNTVITGIPEGSSITLGWTITDDICPSVADTVTIATTLSPSAPDAGEDQNLCNSPDATLMGNSPDPDRGNGTWSLISGTGNIGDLNAPVTNVSGLSIGNNLFAWTISNGDCAPLSDTVVIINNDGDVLKANFLVSEVACVGEAVYMFDISENETMPTGFLWNFGDNTTSEERDPVHVYTQQGEYTISLITLLNDCASASVSKNIRVFNCLENPGPEGARKIVSASVVPNPSIDDFRVTIKLREESKVDITLYDAVGKTVATRSIEGEKEITAIFEPEASGLYFFQVKTGVEVLLFKVIKVNGSD